MNPSVQGWCTLQRYSIRRSFSQANHTDYMKLVHLNTAAVSSIQDVSTFLTKQIGKIVEKHDLNWKQWSGAERMQTLCIRASSIAIWAITSTKFIQEQINTSGKEGLNELLDALRSEGLGDINVLYDTILNITYKRSDEWVIETFRRIVGCVVVLQEPLSVGAIGDMLDLRKTKGGDRVDFINFFRRLRTVLIASANAIDNNTVPRLHNSSFEFITSERAENRFRVYPELSNGEIVTQCLGTASTNHIPTKHSPPNSVPPPLWYTIRFWGTHLPQEEGAPSEIFSK
jgi:hypothetical protein